MTVANYMRVCRSRGSTEAWRERVWTVQLSSAKSICIEFYRRTLPNTIVEDHTTRLSQGDSCGEIKLVERSPRHLCWRYLPAAA